MESLSELQKEVFKNKVKRGFNVTGVGREIIFMTEELGELAKAYRDSNRKPAADINNKDAIVDAIGDIMIYCIGLCEMLGVESEDVLRNIVNNNAVRTHRSKAAP